MRPLLGIFKGVTLGGGLGLLYGLTGLVAAAPWFNWIFYPLLGALVGLLGGKPFWRHDRITVIVKAVVGAVVLTGLYAVVVHAVGDPRLAFVGIDRPMSQVPELLGGLLGVCFGALVELDEKAVVGRAARVLWLLAAVAVIGGAVYLRIAAAPSSPAKPTPAPARPPAADAGPTPPRSPRDARLDRPRPDRDFTAEVPTDGTLDMPDAGPPDGAANDGSSDAPGDGGARARTEGSPADAGPSYLSRADARPPATATVAADGGAPAKRTRPRPGQPTIVATLPASWLEARVVGAGSTSGEPFTRVKDRGRLFYLGATKAPPTRLVFWRLADGELVLAPTPSFPPRSRIDNLLYFDGRGGEAAALLVRDRQRYLVTWRPGGGPRRKHTLRANTRLESYYLLVGGYDPLARQLYALRMTVRFEAIGTTGMRVSSKPSPVQVVAISASGLREVGEPFAVHASSSRAFYDSVRRRFVVLEYGEHPYGTAPPPRGYLVEPASGRRIDFEIPAAAYAAHFTDDGQRLLVHGYQRGTLWEIDLDKGRRLRTRRTGGGWALGKGLAGTLVLVRNKAIDRLDARRLTLRKRLDLTRLLPRKAHHTQGSLVLGQDVVLSLWGDLYLIRFPSAASKKK